jgi:long-chain fatty acid transport protein
MRSTLSAFGAALLVAGLASLPRAASASPLFELVGGVTGTGGFNARVTGAGAPSTYFNPALLPQATQGFELGVLVLSDQISMTLDGRPSGDVPLSLGNFDAYVDGQPISKNTIPTQWLQKGCPAPTCSPPFAARPRQADGSSGNTRAYQIIGLVSHLVDDRFVLGLHALVPYGKFTTANSFYDDEREQFFSNSLHPELYSDRLTATSLAFGVGSRILKNLSIGMSFTLTLVNAADAKTYVPNSSDYNQLLLSTDVGVNAAVAPHFGVAWTPIEDLLHLAAAVHTVQKLEIDTQFGAILPGGNESSTSRTAVHDYVPAIYSLGGVVDLSPKSRNKLSVAGTANYATWSNYIDRHGEMPDREGSVYAWRDTVSGSLGLRFARDAFGSYIDVAYQPSPVPLQTGRTNYVDNDRVSLGIGAQYEFELFGMKFRASAETQAHKLIYRHQKKDDSRIIDELPDRATTLDGKPVAGAAGLQTNNPGWPGFASEGYVFGASAAIALLY